MDLKCGCRPVLGQCEQCGEPVAAVLSADGLVTLPLDQVCEHVAERSLALPGITIRTDDKKADA